MQKTFFFFFLLLFTDLSAYSRSQFVFLLLSYLVLLKQKYIFITQQTVTVRMLRKKKFSLLSQGISLYFGRRFNVLEHRTKGSPHMKHLDLYARRDPQLAPYLLREVDIEYKRKCRKVSFLYWVVLFTMAIALQSRIQGESVHHLRNYASLINLEQEAKDADNLERRRILVEIMEVCIKAFNRDQKWRKEDYNSVRNSILENESKI